MECPIQAKENADQLLAYSSRTLDPETSAVLDRHIANCESCRKLVEGQRMLWEALDSWDAMPVSRNFDRNLYERIEDEERRQGWWRALARPFYGVSWRPAMPLAVASVTILAVFLLRSPEQPDYQPQLRSESVDIEQVENTLEDLEMLRLLTPPPGSVVNQ